MRTNGGLNQMGWTPPSGGDHLPSDVTRATAASSCHMDIAKHVFQLHAVMAQTGEIQRIKLKRNQVIEFFTRREPSLVVMEACGSAHCWARQLMSLGHDVKLIAPRSVRPFVLRNKTDAADARAIWTAAQQPDARFVAVKTEAQQAILALHRLSARN